MAFVNHSRAEKSYKRRVETQSDDYRNLFRFNEGNVHWLANHFIGEQQIIERRGGALNPDQKMKIFLRYMADPGYQNSVGEVVGVKQSTVSKTIVEMSRKIIAKSRLWVKFPSSNEDIREAKQQWKEKYSFRGTIGANYPNFETLSTW